jgi:hypothetical protein
MIGTGFREIDISISRISGYGEIGNFPYSSLFQVYFSTLLLGERR